MHPSKAVDRIAVLLALSWTVLFAWNHRGAAPSPEGRAVESLSPRLDVVLEGRGIERFQDVVPADTIRAVVNEYAGLGSDAQMSEANALHIYFHLIKDELLALEQWRGFGIVLYSGAFSPGMQVDFGSVVKSIQEIGVGPAYTVQVLLERTLTVYAVPLPYEANRGFWDIRLRMEVLSSMGGLRGGGESALESGERIVSPDD